MIIKLNMNSNSSHKKWLHSRTQLTNTSTAASKYAWHTWAARITAFPAFHQVNHRKIQAQVFLKISPVCPVCPVCKIPFTLKKTHLCKCPFNYRLMGFTHGLHNDAPAYSALVERKALVARASLLKRCPIYIYIPLLVQSPSCIRPSWMYKTNRKKGKPVKEALTELNTDFHGTLRTCVHSLSNDYQQHATSSTAKNSYHTLMR